jgi:hypothetical protein
MIRCCVDNRRSGGGRWPQPSHSLDVDPGRWQAGLEELLGRVEPRRWARAFVLGLLAHLPRKHCWTLAEHAGAGRSGRRDIKPCPHRPPPTTSRLATTNITIYGWSTSRVMVRNVTTTKPYRLKGVLSVTPNVPAVLDATSGAIPALLLAVVLEPPLFGFLSRRDKEFRRGLEALQRNRLARMLLPIALVPFGTTIAFSQFATTIIGLSGVALFSGIALQMVPAGSWSVQLGWWVIGAHLVIVALLVLIVVEGLILLMKGASFTGRRDRDGGEGGRQPSQPG